MAHGRLYYLWLYLPDTVKLPLYIRSKKRRQTICNLILASLEAGEAKLYRAGEATPMEDVRRSNEALAEDNLFTNVILKYHTSTEINFSLGDSALIKMFLRLLRGSEEVMITGDNTRMLIDTDKYRQVILEGRKAWFPHGGKTA